MESLWADNLLSSYVQNVENVLELEVQKIIKACFCYSFSLPKYIYLNFFFTNSTKVNFSSAPVKII